MTKDEINSKIVDIFLKAKDKIDSLITEELVDVYVNESDWLSDCQQLDGLGCLFELSDCYKGNGIDFKFFIRDKMDFEKEKISKAEHSLNVHKSNMDYYLKKIETEKRFVEQYEKELEHLQKNIS